MFGDHRRILILALVLFCHLHQPIGSLLMIRPPYPLEYALVHHVSQQHMFENVLIHVHKTAVLPLIDHLAYLERCQCTHIAL